MENERSKDLNWVQVPSGRRDTAFLPDAGAASGILLGAMSRLYCWQFPTVPAAAAAAAFCLENYEVVSSRPVRSQAVITLSVFSPMWLHQPRLTVTNSISEPFIGDRIQRRSSADRRDRTVTAEERWPLNHEAIRSTVIDRDQNH